MNLQKLGIRDTYFFKPKYLKSNTMKVHLKRECPQKDISRLEDQVGVFLKMKVVNLGKR